MRAGTEITAPVSFPPCRNTFLGAVAGSLTALGTPTTTRDVAGYTGLGFVTNTNKDEVGPCSTIGLRWRSIFAAVSTLGWALEVFHERGPLPKPAAEATKRQLFRRVQQALRANRPVIVWGLVRAEWGIVRGSRGEAYLVRTFRTPAGFPETPVDHLLLQTGGGGYWALFFTNPTRGPSSSNELSSGDVTGRDRAAVSRGWRWAVGKVKAMRGYVTGPAAPRRLARLLETIDTNPKQSPAFKHADAYLVERWQELKRLASDWLAERAQAHAGAPQAPHLGAAARVYKHLADLLDGYPPEGVAGPAGESGKALSEARTRWGATLREASRVEETAAGQLKAALDAWRDSY